MVVYRELVVMLLIQRYVADNNHIFGIEHEGIPETGHNPGYRCG